MEIKKVKAEVVKPKAQRKPSKIWPLWARIKLGIAIVLDIIDFLIGLIPLINAAWDIVTFLVLLLIIRNKKLALLPLIEVPLILPPFSIIGMFIPIATITVLIDNGIGDLRIHRF